MSHEHIEMTAHISSYVLHDLTAEQEAEFTAHLDGCAGCQTEVAEFRQTLALLSETVATPPPPALRAATLDAIAQVRPLPPLQEPPARSAGSAVSPLSPHHQSSPLPRDDAPEPGPVSPAQPAAITSLHERRRPPLQWAIAAAMVLVALAGLGGFIWGQQRGLQAQPSTTVTVSSRQAELLAAPDLTVQSAELPAGGRATYYVSKKEDLALVVLNGLPAKATGQTFQLWTIHDGAPVPSTLFDSGAVAGSTTPTQVMIEGGITGAQGIAMTVEPIGGSQRPTSTVMAAVTLT